MQQDQDKEILADSIVKGIAYAENGGKPDINNPKAGKSGELKSIFQFEPATWKADAKAILGSENAPLTPDNETYVMREKVKKWIDEGKTVSEMASIHNAGDPNAYKENHKGVNRYGVKYDTPAYAKKVLSYSKEFYDKKSNIIPEGTALTTQPQPMPTNSGPLATILDTIKKAQANTQSPIQDSALNPSISNQALPKQELAKKLPGLFKGNVKTNSANKGKKVKVKGLVG